MQKLYGALEENFLFFFQRMWKRKVNQITLVEAHTKEIQHDLMIEVTLFLYLMLRVQ
jgi:hypothetical protein